MMKIEFWRPINENYSISNYGRVRSERYNRLIKPYKASGRYLNYAITYNKKVKNKQLHRLLAEAFIPNPNNKPQVNHIDGNIYNNRLDNLEWVTASENTLHAIRTGLQKSSRWGPYKNAN